MTAQTTLAAFAESLAGPGVIERLRAGQIGEGALFDGPFGARSLVYADHTASGRALRQVESFMLEQVLPWYANSHTEASHVGGLMTRLRREARAVIAAHCGADARHAVIFSGAGATAGLNRLPQLFGLDEAVRQGNRPLVVIGPYEHHSNILVWRECGAEVVELPEAPEGGPDLVELERVLAGAGPRPKLGAFSAASNVTGILTDTDAVTEVLRRHGALAVWDYAGGGPYLPIDMRAGTPCEKDAVVFSVHKFMGGPGASGITVLNRAAVSRARPVFTGGGTVRFVSPWGHDYSADVTVREEAGTPNVTGDIRAALAVMVKDAIGQAFMDTRLAELRSRALEVWSRTPGLHILGNPAAARALPIFSLQIADPVRGGLLHQQLVTRMLSDLHGIQARGGCACAGPYAHRLLGIDPERSGALRSAILSGQEVEKPGWTRLNLSALMEDAKADMVIRCVDELARAPYPMAAAYCCDESTARFRPEGSHAA